MSVAIDGFHPNQQNVFFLLIKGLILWIFQQDPIINNFQNMAFDYFKIWLPIVRLLQFVILQYKSAFYNN